MEESKKSSSFMKQVKKQWVLLLISALLVIYGIVFYYIPLVGWLMAFQNYKSRTGLRSPFIGLAKFKFLFEDATFIQAVRNTFAMGVLNLVTTTILAILFAILLNEVRNTLVKKSIQTISYLPHFLSWVIVCGILHDNLSSTGIVNIILEKTYILEFLNNIPILSNLLKLIYLDKTPVLFFAHPVYFWPIVAFANCWKETGWNAIIYLAAITSIDPCLYEAASIDGAGRLSKIKYITLPSIKPTIMILLIMNIGNVLNAGFEIQYILGNGLLIDVSQTIDIYVLKWGVSQADYSLGTAAGIFKSAVAIALILIANFIAKRAGEERLF